MKVLIILVVVIIVLIGIIIFQNELSRRAFNKKPAPIVVDKLSTTVQSQLSDLVSAALSSFSPSGNGLSKTEMVDALKQALDWSSTNLQHRVIAVQGGTWTVDLSTATLNAIRTKFEAALNNTVVKVDVQGGSIVATLDGASLSSLETINVDVTGLIPLTISGYDQSALDQLKTIFGSNCCSQPIEIAATSISTLVDQLSGMNVNATVSGPVTISSASIASIAKAISGETFNVNIGGQPLSITGTVSLGDISALTDWLSSHNLNINDGAIINAINDFKNANKALNVTKTEICYKTPATGSQVFKGYEYETYYSDGTSNVIVKDGGRNPLKPDQYSLVDCSCNTTCLVQKTLVQCDWYVFDSPTYQFRVGYGSWMSYYPIKTNEGLIYEISSFKINGAEQLSSLFYYTILNPGMSPTYGPYADEGIVVYQNSYNYIANFSMIFGSMFKFLNLDSNWKCILNPSDNNKTGTVLRFIYPQDVGNWSITFTRHDGVEFRYTSDGLLTRTDGSWDSNMTGYTYCTSPSLIGTAPPIQCQYLCWDRSNTEQQLGGAPFTWTVTTFEINGIPMLASPFSRTYGPSQIVLSPDPSYTLNNQIFLNDLFASLSLSPAWNIMITGFNTFDLLYPGDVQEFVMVIMRANGQKYVYRNGGFTTNFDGFTSENSYPTKCTLLGSKFRPSRLDVKASKLETPLSFPPPKSSRQIVGLLRQRLMTVRVLLKKKMRSSNFRLCLFGSQIKGVSSSGKPDIDLWVVPTKSPMPAKMDKIIEEVKNEVDFKLDLTMLNPETLKKMVYVEFD